MRSPHFVLTMKLAFFPCPEEEKEGKEEKLAKQPDRSNLRVREKGRPRKQNESVLPVSQGMPGRQEEKRSS